MRKPCLFMLIHQKHWTSPECLLGKASGPEPSYYLLFLKLFKLSFIFQNILRVNITNPRVGIESKQRSKWKWNLWWVSACGSEPVFRRCRFDTVCCFGTKITHTLMTLSMSRELAVAITEVSYPSLCITALIGQFCKHATKANFLRWSALEASSVGSFRGHVSPVIFKDFSECT